MEVLANVLSMVGWALMLVYVFLQWRIGLDVHRRLDAIERVIGRYYGRASLEE